MTQMAATAQDSNKVVTGASANKRRLAAQAARVPELSFTSKRVGKCSLAGG